MMCIPVFGALYSRFCLDSKLSDRESGVEKENVRPRDEEQSSSPSRPARLEEGMKVEVNYKGNQLHPYKCHD